MTSCLITTRSSLSSKNWCQGLLSSWESGLLCDRSRSSGSSLGFWHVFSRSDSYFCLMDRVTHIQSSRESGRHSRNTFQHMLLNLQSASSNDIALLCSLWVMFPNSKSENHSLQYFVEPQCAPFGPVLGSLFRWGLDRDSTGSNPKRLDSIDVWMLDISRRKGTQVNN